MAYDLLLGHTSRSYARGDLGPDRADVSLLLCATSALLLAPLASRLLEGLSRVPYRRGSRPTLEVPIVPMREMVASRPEPGDLEYTPRMYRGDTRRTREMPAVEVSEQVERVYGRRLG